MTTTANESTDIRLARLEERVDGVQEGQRQILARMDTFDARLDALYSRLDALYARMDARMDALHAAHRQMMLTIAGLGTTLILAVIGGTITLAIRLG